MASMFLNLAKKVLLEEKKPLAYTEIWSIALAKGYEKQLGSLGKTPSDSLGAMLYVDVRDNPDSEFLSIGIRPKRFYLKSLPSLTAAEEKTIDAPEHLAKKFNYLEKDIHPFLVYYGYNFLHANIKTIHHNRSGKTEFGEWVHPDLVGCYYPYNNWGNEVVDVSVALGNSAVKLYSFEMKRELNFGNLRQAFFQAVSNSSWANEGYLVASEIDENDELKAELERLSTSFGIGVIGLNVEDPDSSKVIFPAKPREYIDWETVNKLSKMNADFSDFLKRVKTDVMSREIRKELYDKVFSKEELLTLIKKDN